MICRNKSVLVVDAAATVGFLLLMSEGKIRSTEPCASKAWILEASPTKDSSSVAAIGNDLKGRITMNEVWIQDPVVWHILFNITISIFSRAYRTRQRPPNSP